MLTKRAKGLERTRSHFVRDLIEKGVAAHQPERSIGHGKGRLKLSTPTAVWLRQVKDRNWR